MMKINSLMGIFVYIFCISKEASLMSSLIGIVMDKFFCVLNVTCIGEL